MKHKCEREKCNKTAKWVVKYDFGIKYLCDLHRNKTEKLGYSQGSKKIIK